MSDSEATHRSVEGRSRSCGPCSLCCTVLRVDELAKLGGSPCLHQRTQGGCAVHARRPQVCRAYRCAWLSGAFGEADRPDLLGAVLDLVTRGDLVRLVVRQRDARSLERSTRLREIVAETRESMPVEVRDVDDVLDPARAYRVLQPDGEEFEIAGDRVRVLRDGQLVSERRASWPTRSLQRLVARVQAWRLQRWPSHRDRLARLGLPSGNLAAPKAPSPAEAEPHDREEERP